MKPFKNKTTPSVELNSGILTKKEMKSKDAENTVPKVADTAKEIEKLVMGDIEQVDSQPPKDKIERPTNEPEDKMKTVTAKEDEQDDRASLQSTSTENLDDSGTRKSLSRRLSEKKSRVSSTSIDSRNFVFIIGGKDFAKFEETKKPIGPTRKSARVTAGKSSSALEAKKSMSTQDIVKELEKFDAEDKATEKEEVSDKAFETKEESTSKASSEVIQN